MPVRETPYSFPALNAETFRGLPGLVCDSLPDTFGNTLVKVWLAETGHGLKNFNLVDQLCYVGNRGIGALEFYPILRDDWRSSIEISQLVDLVSRVSTTDPA